MGLIVNVCLCLHLSVFTAAAAAAPVAAAVVVLVVIIRGVCVRQGWNKRTNIFSLLPAMTLLSSSVCIASGACASRRRTLAVPRRWPNHSLWNLCGGHEINSWCSSGVW